MPLNGLQLIQQQYSSDSEDEEPTCSNKACQNCIYQEDQPLCDQCYQNIIKSSIDKQPNKSLCSDLSGIFEKGLTCQYIKQLFNN